MSVRPIDRDEPDSITDEGHGMDAPVATRDAVPETRSLVEVRGQRWVVSDASPGAMEARCWSCRASRTAGTARACRSSGRSSRVAACCRRDRFRTSPPELIYERYVAEVEAGLHEKRGRKRSAGETRGSYLVLIRTCRGCGGDYR
jgi:hypothetical protein